MNEHQWFPTWGSGPPQGVTSFELLASIVLHMPTEGENSHPQGETMDGGGYTGTARPDSLQSTLDLDEKLIKKKRNYWAGLNISFAYRTNRGVQDATRTHNSTSYTSSYCRG